MSNKVYVIFNSDIGKVLAVVKGDEQLAREYLYDFFFEDVMYQWFWMSQYNKDFNPEHDASDIWYELLDWYYENVDIFESEVIE